MGNLEEARKLMAAMGLIMARGSNESSCDYGAPADSVTLEILAIYIMYFIVPGTYYNQIAVAYLKTCVLSSTLPNWPVDLSCLQCARVCPTSQWVCICCPAMTDLPAARSGDEQYLPHERHRPSNFIRYSQIRISWQRKLCISTGHVLFHVPFAWQH